MRFSHTDTISFDALCETQPLSFMSSFWRFLTSSELRWSVGLLVFSSAPVVCVYQLYLESQAGRVSIHDSDTLRTLDPQQAKAARAAADPNKGYMQNFGPRAAAEKTDELLTRLFGPPEK